MEILIYKQMNSAPTKEQGHEMKQEFSCERLRLAQVLCADGKTRKFLIGHFSDMENAVAFFQDERFDFPGSAHAIYVDGILRHSYITPQK